MAQLPSPSAEQKAVIENLGHSNVLVDSVAGSGKTTTNLHIAKHYGDKTILLLTYNKKLKFETREKVKKYDLSVEVHSYHAFCVAYYKRDCFRDDGIAQILETRAAPIRAFSFDIVIIDEAQDVRPMYHALICKILGDNKVIARICVLGDRYQSIYGFNGADSRFITLAPALYGKPGTPWASTTLSTSFRVTNEIAGFVNNCMLGYERIRAQKPGPAVRYIICNAFQCKGTDDSLAEFKRYLAIGAPEEIFVLAYSMKVGKGPARVLANKVSSMGIPIYVPLSDDGAIDEEETKGKVLFSTFHQSKGLERKYVIIFGFDASYYKFFAKDEKPNTCPNLLYVAATRASNSLSIIHHNSYDYLPFLNIQELPDRATIVGLAQPKPIPNNTINYAVTKMTRHIPSEVMARALTFLDIAEIKPPGAIIDVPDKVVQKSGLVENVSDITGIAIPAFYELEVLGSMSIYEQLLGEGKISDVFGYARTNVWAQLKKIRPTIALRTTALLTLSNIYNCYRSEFVHKLNQIDRYDWITRAQLRKFMARIEQTIGNKGLYFEIPVHFIAGNGSRISGQLDCIVGQNVYEFKCTSQLEDEHKLQLGLYMFLCEHNYRVMMRQRLEERLLLVDNGVGLREYEVGDQITYWEGPITYASKRIVEVGPKLTVICAPGKTMQVDRARVKCNHTVARLARLDINDEINLIKAQIASLEHMDDEISKNYFLFNIKTGQILQLKSTFARLQALFDYIWAQKQEPRPTVTDEVFLARNRPNLEPGAA